MDTLLEYKCPSCGGAIEFHSDIQKMKCPYCDTEFEMETLRELDEVLKNTPQEDMSWQTQAGSTWQTGEEENLSSYICQSCGGQIVTDATTSATSCPYCGNPVVMAGQVSGALRPDCIIPFKLDKKAAETALLNHLKGKPLLPKVFKDENHIKEVKGVYVPFWLFDTKAGADIRYRGTKTRFWSDSRYNYTETRYFSLHRSGSLGFSAVPVDGSSKMANDLMESLEPFDLSQAVDFQTAYLAGFYADKYDVSAQDSTQRANERIKVSTEQTFAQTTMGYGGVYPESSSIRLSQSKARYALYPVWLLSTRYRDQDYLFAMNGQTGKFVGNLPMDKAAFWKWWAAIAAGVTLIMGLAMMLL